jgi:hypothetical protein
MILKTQSTSEPQIINMEQCFLNVSSSTLIPCKHGCPNWESHNLGKPWSYACWLLSVTVWKFVYLFFGYYIHSQSYITCSTDLFQSFYFPYFHTPISLCILGSWSHSWVSRRSAYLNWVSNSSLLLLEKLYLTFSLPLTQRVPFFLTKTLIGAAEYPGPRCFLEYRRCFQMRE